MSSESNGEPPRKLRSALLLGVAMLAASSGALYLRNGGDDYRQIRQRQEKLRSEYQRLQDKNERLELRIRRLHQDPQLIKEIARRRLGLRDPGEKRIRMRDPATDSPSKSTSADVD